MTTETFLVEQPWIDIDGRLRLERRQTDTYEDGSFTVTVSNEMPVGATTISRPQYDAQMGAIAIQMDGSRGDLGAVTETPADVQQRVSIREKLVALGFTQTEAEAIFP